MIRSMTAFARRENQGEWGSLSVELRSVNHRFLEVSTRLPEELRALETALREAVGKRLSRGKVDCTVRFQPAGATEQMNFNRELADRLAHLSREVDALLYNPAPINSLELLQWPGVLQAPTPDPEALNQQALQLLGEALDELTETREREGAKLKAIIEQRCAAMAEVVTQVRQRLPEVMQHLRQRLENRLAEIRAELDHSRLEQELVMLAQKADVDEEMDRLEAHIQEVRRVLGQRQPVGRRLDFLMQELNRGPTPWAPSPRTPRPPVPRWN